MYSPDLEFCVMNYFFQGKHMNEPTTKIKIDAESLQAAIKRVSDFWATIDGDKLAQLCLEEKDMDLIGRKKDPKNSQHD